VGFPVPRPSGSAGRNKGGWVVGWRGSCHTLAALHRRCIGYVSGNDSPTMNVKCALNAPFVLHHPCWTSPYYHPSPYTIPPQPSPKRQRYLIRMCVKRIFNERPPLPLITFPFLVNYVDLVFLYYKISIFIREDRRGFEYRSLDDLREWPTEGRQSVSVFVESCPTESARPPVVKPRPERPQPSMALVAALLENPASKATIGSQSDGP